MTDHRPKWTLAELIEFESAIDRGVTFSDEMQRKAAEVARSREGGAARSAAFRVLAAEIPAAGMGRKTVAALSFVSVLAAGCGFFLGVSGVLGVMNQSRGGMPVPEFLIVLVFSQWVLLLLAGVGLMFRGKNAAGFTLAQSAIGAVTRKLASGRENDWWQRVMWERGPVRTALLWRFAAIAQMFGVWFNIGLFVALGGLVLTRHIGFFWETTTSDAMRTLLEQVTAWLSLPWIHLWPEAVPGADVIDASRWFPGKILAPGPGEWWRFLLMTIFVWGMLPRLILWILANGAGSRAFTKLDFQSRVHRGLWRSLFAGEAAILSEEPVDGVLVLDIGGTGISKEKLRPFLLQVLRVNPSSWHSLAILDDKEVAEATRAISLAPAGAVLVCEDWALSPARMTRIHANLRAGMGEKPIRFLVLKSGGEKAVAPDEGHRAAWEEFVDSLRDPAAEVVFYREIQPAL